MLGATAPIKDRELYEALRAGGASQEEAAREEVGRRGVATGSYRDRAVGELRKHVAQLDIVSRLSMRNAGLIGALRNH